MKMNAKLSAQWEAVAIERLAQLNAARDAKGLPALKGKRAKDFVADCIQHAVANMAAGPGISPATTPIPLTKKQTIRIVLGRRFCFQGADHAAATDEGMRWLDALDSVHDQACAAVTDAAGKRLTPTTQKRLAKLLRETIQAAFQLGQECSDSMRTAAHSAARTGMREVTAAQRKTIQAMVMAAPGRTTSRKVERVIVEQSGVPGGFTESQIQAAMKKPRVQTITKKRRGYRPR